MFGYAWCSGAGTAGWLVMGAAWLALIAFAVLALLRLFPEPARSPRSPRDTGGAASPNLRDSSGNTFVVPDQAQGNRTATAGQDSGDLT